MTISVIICSELLICFGDQLSLATQLECCEKVALLYSRSVSQPRLKVSVNVSLDGILCIAEPFVTKPNTVRHPYKPERHMRKMCFYLQDQGRSN